MLKDKEIQSATSSSGSKDLKETLKDLNEVKALKILNIDTSAGVICDINTGICGPVNQKKEGKE